MKTTQIKKNLKNASIEIRSQEQNYGYLATWLLVRYQDNYGPTTLIRIDAQSNSLLSNDSLTDRKTAKTHNNLWFPGFSGSYAAGCKAEIKFSYGSNDYDNPERCLNFMKVIRATIEKYNINHVYPDCELSQIVTAMERLGSNVTETYINDSSETMEWKRDRRKKVDQWNEVHTELKVSLYA